MIITRPTDGLTIRLQELVIIMKTIKSKKAIWLLGIILVSYFVVGFPDGAYTVSWHGIAEDIAGMTTASAGWILVGYSVTYTLAGIILSWLNRFMKLQTAYFWGLVVMGLGFVGLALSQNFTMVLSTITIYGFGTGLMASSMNAYMAKHYTAKHNNWMHCFWGGGASLSPIIMGQMMAILTWRAGYFVISGIVAIVGVMLLVSFAKKMWLDDSDKQSQDTSQNMIVKKRYLTKKWHQILEILTFFFLGGTDYTLVFFTGAALMARGTHTHEEIVIFSTVYYVAMTVGRMLFGWATKFLKEVPIERIGILISIVGLGVVYFASNVIGMALLGFGLSPLLPTLVSDSSNRFTPNILSKIVGLELAAFGAGIAALFLLTSQLMHFVTYEALFPLALSFILLVFLCNEVLAFALKREQKRNQS